MTQPSERRRAKTERKDARVEVPQGVRCAWSTHFLNPSSRAVYISSESLQALYRETPEIPRTTCREGRVGGMRKTRDKPGRKPLVNPPAQMAISNTIHERVVFYLPQRFLSDVRTCSKYGGPTMAFIAMEHVQDVRLEKK